MKFYDLEGSPNTRRLRIFLAEKGLELETVAIDFRKGEHKTPEYLAKNSLGMMPLLELDDGTCISESVAICRYLDELHPQPPMFGRDALERAQVEMWNRRMELEILNPMMQVFGHTHKMWAGIRRQVAEWGEVSREKALTRMEWLDGELAGQEFIAGNDYTVADITAQCGILLGKAVDVRIPGGLDNLTGWWERVIGRPSARA
jgi:glutathione S-transferase